MSDSSVSNRVAKQNAAIVGIGTLGLFAWDEYLYDLIAIPIARFVPAAGILVGDTAVAKGIKWTSGGLLLLIAAEFSAIQFVK